MPKKEDALFQAWLEDVKERIADDPELEEKFDAFVAHPIGKEVFRGHLREADYHRKAQALADERRMVEAEKEQLNTRATELEAWYEQNAPINERLKAERDELRARLEAGSDSESEPPARGRESAVDDLTKKEIEELKSKLAETEAWAKQVDVGVPALMGGFLDVAVRSVKEGFEIKPRELMEYAMKKRIDPEQAYAEITAEERQKRAEADMEKRLEKAKEEGRREALKSQVASPDRLRAAAPAIWQQAFNKTPQARGERVDSAVEAWLDTAD